MSLKDLSALASPLSAEQLAAVQQVTAQLNPIQQAWVSGYLAGIAQAAGGNVAALAAAPAAVGSLTILYGSQTGNAKGVAAQVLAKAQAQNIPAQLVNMADFKVKALKDESHIIVVTSTNGEGEPPDDAMMLHEFIFSKKAPKLEKLEFAVLALGDSSYEFFCQTGKDFDEQFAKLGATRVLDRVDCDVDYEADAAAWTEQALAIFKDKVSASATAAPIAGFATAGSAVHYDKKNPLVASLATNQKITGRDSDKDIRHIEIDLSDSGLSYQTGDALGVWFNNDEAVVARVLQFAALSGDEVVSVDGNEKSLRQALVEDYELTLTHPGFIESYREVSQAKELVALGDDKGAIREFAARIQIADVLALAPTALSAEQLLSALRRMTPRLYSIASAQAEVGEEVHLTVGIVRYQKDGEDRAGGCSGFLADRLEDGAQVRVFVEHNDNFRLPADGNTPVIMVGPGTGIAPFRAFMQQRDADGAEGGNWLFFGNPHFTDDFLYQVEWQAYKKSGLLTKIDLAWSRDQAHKIYVQDRIREQGAEVYQWLEQGAHFYVCGDASRMAKDVHEALIDVVAQHGQKSREAAEEYVNELRRAKRYQRDVY